MKWDNFEKKQYLAGQKFATVAEIGSEKVQYGGVAKKSLKNWKTNSFKSDHG